MKVLITSGGTTEKIDEVRKIKNMATGRLGALIAEQFSTHSKTDITYLCSTDAVIPAVPKIEILEIESVKELTETLTKLLSKSKYDIIIHAMAVSDYTVKNVMSAKALASSVARALCGGKHFAEDIDSVTKAVHSAIIQSNTMSESAKKISSNVDDLIIFMDKTPKVIRFIKQLQPDTILVGFKLLAGVDEDTLLNAGHNLLLQNSCDFVFANDLTQINNDSHTGILISPDFTYQRFYSKQEIAHGIVVSTLEKIGGSR